MNTIDLPLTEPLEQFIAQRVAAGGFASGKDYILALLEQTRQAEERAAMEAKLLDGIAALDRGEGQPMTVNNWERLRADVRARHGASNREPACNSFASGGNRP
jgi:Arc/MetJ-type ribon-helix-helix transcriptional regulator